MEKLKCILLVDDDEATNYFNNLILEDMGIVDHIQTVKNGKLALDYMLQEGEFENMEDYKRPDLIFLDLNMPRMNGIEFLQEYSLSNNSSDIPVIVVLTTSLNDNDRETVLQYDFVKKFLNKPLKPDVISSVIAEFFQ